MNPPFSFQDTNMVFHAPVQRRHVGSDVRPTPSAPLLAARHTAAAPTAYYQPEERSYSPLPTLPTLMRTRSHLRSMPDLGRSPISSPMPAPAREAPIYRPFTLKTTDSPGIGETPGDHRDRFRAPSRESTRSYSQYDDSDERDYNDDRLHAYSAPSRFLPHRHVRQDSTSGRLDPDSYADLPRYTSSPLAYPDGEPQRANPARVRPVEPLSAPITEPVKKKRKARICTTEGCTKYVVDHGLCIRHGGGKRCYIDGCECRAQNRGLCWKHGGFTICKVDGCTKRAKSRGICWSHGGGTRCKRDECSKIAVSNGLCWAHGGGKRCTFGKCRKPASERTDNFCNEHYAQEYNSVQEADL